MTSNHNTKPLSKAQKQLRGEYLDSLADRVEVSFSPAGRLAGEEESRGHLYAVHVETLADDEYFALDDRLPESLEDQLEAELRRYAGIYIAMADKVRDEHQARQRARSPRPDKVSMAREAAA